MKNVVMHQRSRDDDGDAALENALEAFFETDHLLVNLDLGRWSRENSETEAACFHQLQENVKDV